MSAPAKPLAAVPLTIDSREPPLLSQVVAGHLTAVGIESEVAALNSADYMMVSHTGTLLGVERKTPDDFLASIADGRLEEQLGRMVDQYDHRLLLIHGTYHRGPDGKVVCGNWSKHRTNWLFSAFMGKMLSIQRRYETALLVVPGDDELVEVLRMLYRQGQEGKFRL